MGCSGWKISLLWHLASPEQSRNYMGDFGTWWVLSFVLATFTAKSSKGPFRMRWLHGVCSRFLRPVCLESEQAGGWCEMSSAQAGLSISDLLGNEGWRDLDKGGSQAIAEFWVEFLHSAWIQSILKDSLGSRFWGWKEHLLCKYIELRRSCCTFCNYLLSTW